METGYAAIIPARLKTKSQQVLYRKVPLNIIRVMARIEKVFIIEVLNNSIETACIIIWVVNINKDNNILAGVMKKSVPSIK